MSSIHGGVQSNDWNDRDLIEIVSRNIKKISDFLNQFDQSCRGKLAELNEKVTLLERHMDYLESCVNGAAAEQSKSAAANPAQQPQA